MNISCSVSIGGTLLEYYTNLIFSRIVGNSKVTMASLQFTIGFFIYEVLNKHPISLPLLDMMFRDFLQTRYQ